MVYYKFIYSKYFQGIASPAIELSFFTKEEIPFVLNVYIPKGYLDNLTEIQHNFLKKVLGQFYKDFLLDCNWFEIVDMYVPEI